jgi:two-component system LytT family response regulator
MSLRCIAIDDEPLALELIRDYCSRNPEIQLVRTFEDAVSGAEFLNKNSVDLLLIDINMPDISGMDLVRSLREKPMIIFTTAYRNFAAEGFDLDAIDYLVKPFEYQRFAKAIAKTIEYKRFRERGPVEEGESIFIYSEYKLVKINLADIEYIESLQDYIKIHLSSTKPLMSLMPLKRILEKLPADKFQRIHRSYIVPLAKIRSVLNKRVQLSSAVELPVGDSYSGFLKR